MQPPFFQFPAHNSREIQPEFSSAFILLPPLPLLHDQYYAHTLYDYNFHTCHAFLFMIFTVCSAAREVSNQKYSAFYSTAFPIFIPENGLMAYYRQIMLHLRVFLLRSSRTLQQLGFDTAFYQSLLVDQTLKVFVFFISS